MGINNTGQREALNVHENDPGLADNVTGPKSAKPLIRRTRWILLVPAALLLLVGGLLTFVLTNDMDKPSTQLGATGETDGGLARIHGIIPVETDGWTPDGPAAGLSEPVQEGAHRVRVLLELTALESDGIHFTANDYSIEGLGAGTPRAIWSSPEDQTAAQGETIEATLIFEIPNQAVSLVLDGNGALRLSLGTEHHTSG
ncbi:hypothetical protein [Arthrobacter sp. H5]|uniref:hypothetical protein n=1 Tax=Arthrobacter sp. H5 TaxID=1267973 RepID=UPI0004B48315|nr:hypothetical protein [Arthrobacter sp. H5]